MKDAYGHILAQITYMMRKVRIKINGFRRMVISCRIEKSDGINDHVWRSDINRMPQSIIIKSITNDISIQKSGFSPCKSRYIVPLLA